MNRLLLAAYHNESEALAAAKAACEMGSPAIDMLTPHPLAQASQYIAEPTERISVGWTMFIAGVAGAALGYGMEWFSAVIAYPINAGGRGLNSWPAFLFVPIEAAILFAGICGFLAWLHACNLPRLHHLIFNAELSERATQNSYVLVFDNITYFDEIRRKLDPQGFEELEG